MPSPITRITKTLFPRLKPVSGKVGSSGPSQFLGIQLPFYNFRGRRKALIALTKGQPFPQKWRRIPPSSADFHPIRHRRVHSVLGVIRRQISGVPHNLSRREGDGTAGIPCSLPGRHYKCLGRPLNTSSAFRHRPGQVNYIRGVQTTMPSISVLGDKQFTFAGV